MALSNVLVALENGFNVFASSSGGLGGCPYAKGASGNVATEDIVYLLDSLGVGHGVDFKKLVEASKYILEKLNKTSTSKYLNAYMAAGK
ncbi:MAG: hydroxymethylglutaryl-CoA lyase, partial [Bacteriovoracaceae bacterium]